MSSSRELTEPSFTEPPFKRQKKEVEKDDKYSINDIEVPEETFLYIVDNAGLRPGLNGGAPRTPALFRDSGESGKGLVLKHYPSSSFPREILVMFLGHIGACLKEGTFYSVERGYAFLEGLALMSKEPNQFIVFILLKIYNSFQFDEYSLTKESTTKDSLLHFISEMLPTHAWMRKFITNFEELSPLEENAWARVSKAQNHMDMHIPMQFRSPGYPSYSFDSHDWLQIKLLMFEYEAIDTFIGTYVRLRQGPLYLCKASNVLHEVIQRVLESRGKLPITVNVSTNADGSFNTSNKTMMLFSNGDKYFGSTVLTCIGGFSPHGMGTFSQGKNETRTVSSIFGFEIKTKEEPYCKCSTPPLTMKPAWYTCRESFFDSCPKHATTDEEYLTRGFQTFFRDMKTGLVYMKTGLEDADADLMSPFDDITPDEINALRSKGLLLSDRFSLVKCDTVALYHEFIEPSETVKREKDQKFFLKLRELGVRLKLLRLTKDDEGGVKAVMDEV